ncbi:MAG: hypothetical protein AUI14_17965 [Actinobacteria bacterium 13_2_20CM_2_71_6]|nr:MAG: hypothetical protein AUI14_17965 [Actinobacteria bacterium 13_2_20CM_2_71_6]
MAQRASFLPLRGRGRRLSAVLSLVVTVAGVGVLVVLGAGNGYPATHPRLQSGSAWLASSGVGQLTLLDGSSAEVAAQVQVAPRGDRIAAVQQGANAYAVNRSTGSIRRVDGATFDVSAPATPVPDARGGLQAFAGRSALYALDTERGVLTSADARTLADRGPPVSLAARVTPEATTLDDAGRLWVLDNVTGDLFWIEEDGRRHVRHGAAQPGGSLLVTAGGAPVVVDTRGRTATSIDPPSGNPRRTVALDLRPDDRLQVSGSRDAARLYLVAARGVLVVCDLTATACAQAVPLGTGGDFGTAVETGGRVFVPDYTTGRVWIVDLQQSRVVAQPQVLSPATRFQLLTRDGVVFFNDPDSEQAGVLRLDGGVRPIAKYDPKDPGKGLSGKGTAGDTPPSPDPTNAPLDNPPPPGGPPPPPANQTDPAGTKAAVRIVLSKPRAVVGEDITLKAVASGGRGAVRTAWTFGDGKGATGLVATHHWAAAGTYQVSVSARFASGETAAASLPVQITAVPPATSTLNLVVAGGGTVTSQPPGISCPPTCSARFVTSDTVTLTPTAAAGSQFVSWGGDCGGNGGTPTCALVLTQDRRASATFGRAPVNVTATVSAIKGSYSGPCPPPKTATTYQAVISVSSGPTTVTFRWTSSNGGDTDPSTKTLTFPGTGPQSQTVTHNEAFYLPGQTTNDWIAVDLMTPSSGQSNHAPYRLTCT